MFFNFAGGHYCFFLLPGAVSGITVKNSYDSIVVNAFLLTFLAYFAFSHLNYSYFLDFFAIDYPGRSKRFSIQLNLRSFPDSFFFCGPPAKSFNGLYEAQNKLEFLFLRESLGVFETPGTLSKFLLSANWLEREMWDTFGIWFKKNYNLRRILTDYGFRGFPLRKDFPLTGYTELWYNRSLQRVVSAPVILVQEFRQFNFLNSWARTLTILFVF